MGVENLETRAKNQSVDQGDITCEVDTGGTVHSDTICLGWSLNFTRVLLHAYTRKKTQ